MENTNSARCGRLTVRWSITNPHWTRYLLRSIAARHPKCDGNITWVAVRVDY